MDITTISGKVITDDMFDEMAKEYEDGTFKGKFGKTIMGRPSIANEEVRSVAFRLPISKIAAIDECARRKGTTRSEFFREIVNEALTKTL